MFITVDHRETKR